MSSPKDRLVFIGDDGHPGASAVHGRNTEVRLALVEAAIGRIDASVGSIQASTEKIAESLGTLARLDERHMSTVQEQVRLEKRQDQLDDDLKEIQIQLPPLIEARKYLVKGVAGIIGAVGLALLGLVLITK